MMKWTIGLLISVCLIIGATRFLSPSNVESSTAVSPLAPTQVQSTLSKQDISGQDKVDTIAGKVIVATKEVDGTKTQVLKLDGRIIYAQEDWSVSVNKVFHRSDLSVLLISVGDGGNACDGSSRFVTIKKDGSVTVTDEFAVCEGDPAVNLEGEAIIATVTDRHNRGEMQWKYADGLLKQIKDIDREAAKNAPLLHFETDVPFKLRGTLVSTSNGKDRKLKLSNPVRTCEACDYTVDSFPIEDGIEIPNVKGETDFDVKMQSPRSGDYIAQIKIATRAEPISLEGSWLCTMRSQDGSDYHDSFTFYGGGNYAIRGLEGNARGVELSGTYEASDNLVVLTQRKLSKGGVESAVNPKQANLSVKKIDNQVFIFEIKQNGEVTSRTCKLQATTGMKAGTSSNLSTAGKHTSSLCEINPAACESINRNNDIRRQVLNDRCSILESQLAGVPGGEYQLRKAGCR